MASVKYLSVLSLVFAFFFTKAQETVNMAEYLKKDLVTTGQWFLAFQHQQNDGAAQQNAFVLKRGYITFSKALNPKLYVRFTQDIITDEEGDDAGNIEMRLKYCYLGIAPFSQGFFKHAYLEAGMVHRPYLDFEEKINRQRLQGTMFLERYKVINSADFGITFFSLLGGEMDREYTSSVSSSFPGRYGSIALGIYNGGGYHALEFNCNKTLEGRVTLRPFSNRVPGLQFTYTFIAGKGNQTDGKSFTNHTLFISMESRWINAGFQYTTGQGNMAGTLLDTNGIVLNVEGCSAFSEIFIIPSTLSVFTRYDHFSTGYEATVNDRLIGGLGWYFYKKNKLLVDVDILKRKGGYDRLLEVVIEILF